MKITGWILLGVGVYLFLDEMAKEQSILGSFLFIAFGILLIYLDNQKEKSNHSNKSKDDTLVERKGSDKYESVTSQDLTSTTNGIINVMTKRQKDAAVCLLGWFAGDNSITLDENFALQVLLDQVCNYIGAGKFKDAFIASMNNFNDLESIINEVSTIRDKKDKECIMLTCYDLAKMSKNDEAMEIVYYVAEKMGYNEDRFNMLINQYQ